MKLPFDFDTHSANELAARIGVSTRTIQRWKLNGITVWQADRMACALGTHPSLIWADWWTR
jgi:hypothetical protein